MAALWWKPFAVSAYQIASLSFSQATFSHGPLVYCFIWATLSFCDSGEAAVPERNSSCPQRPCMALPVWWEGEERAEPRKVSGSTASSFTSSSHLCLNSTLSSFHFEISFEIGTESVVIHEHYSFKWEPRYFYQRAGAIAVFIIYLFF